MKTLKADFARYRSNVAPSLWRVALLAISRVEFRAVLCYRLGHLCRERGLSFAAGFFDRVNFHLNHCSISSTAKIGPGFKIVHAGGIVIGGKTEIGTNCDIRHGTTFGGNSGKIRAPGSDWSQPKIGDNVTVGCHVAILGPVLVGANARIGACSLVLADVDEGATVGGVPAKRLGV